jgi:2-oxo-4-hydroxy-4-carboxy--5-ureidoimidazoline (OHCU) decarboxylase
MSGWLEAIEAHPRLGDKLAMAAKRSTSVSDIQVKTAGEQDDLLKERGDVLDELMKWNKRYEEKFGHIFLLFAHGKHMAQVLENIQARCDVCATAQIIHIQLMHAECVTFKPAAGMQVQQLAIDRAENFCPTRS